MTPAPGMFAVIRTTGGLSPMIAIGEKLTDGLGKWTHAVVCTSVDQLGIPWITEAEPGGAVNVPFHYWDNEYQWSGEAITAGKGAEIAAAAIRRAGTPYSYADYFAIAAHKLRIPAPNLREYIAGDGHMICSQLADKCYQDAGVQLFNDGRWNGYVTPGDLGKLISHSRQGA